MPKRLLENQICSRIFDFITAVFILYQMPRQRCIFIETLLMSVLTGHEFVVRFCERMRDRERKEVRGIWR